MPQFERELTEEEGRKLNEIWEKWLKNKPVQQIQPSDIFCNISESEKQNRLKNGTD